MRFEVLTIMPEFFGAPLATGVIGRAIAAGIIEVKVRNIRDYALDRHRTTDDYPYGGGQGMVMKVEPVARALEAAVSESGGARPKVILTTPQGARLDQSVAASLAADTVSSYAIVCGRYEGFDERIREMADIELSIGDYVMTGGEAAALVIIDAVGRLVPGVLGSDESAGDESFSHGLLEYPQYTRPEEYGGRKVPEVLLSGNHAEIRKWRRRESLRRTFLRRPDLIEGAGLSEEEKRFLDGLRGGAVR